MMKMPDVLRVRYSRLVNPAGESVLRPILSLTLFGKESLSVSGLVDSGADVSVLPYSMGLALGAQGIGEPQFYLTGSSGRVPAWGFTVNGAVADFPTVKLAFAWKQVDDSPVILGQINFFSIFNICFFREEEHFEIQWKNS
jgi:hypothetical protein